MTGTVEATANVQLEPNHQSVDAGSLMANSSAGTGCHGLVLARFRKQCQNIQTADQVVVRMPFR